MGDVNLNHEIQRNTGLGCQCWQHPATSQMTRSYFSFSSNDSRRGVWLQLWIYFILILNNFCLQKITLGTVSVIQSFHCPWRSSTRYSNIKWNNGWPFALIGSDFTVVLIFSSSDLRSMWVWKWLWAWLVLCILCSSFVALHQDLWTVKSLTWIFQLPPRMFDNYTH